jgi:hypothetical protein
MPRSTTRKAQKTITHEENKEKKRKTPLLQIYTARVVATVKAEKLTPKGRAKDSSKRKEWRAKHGWTVTGSTHNAYTIRRVYTTQEYTGCLKH